MTQRSKLVAGVLAVATILTGATLVWSNSSPGATACPTVTHSGNTLTAQCADGIVNVPGTFIANTTSTLAPTTTSTAAPVTTTSATSPATTTTAPGVQLTCTAFGAATNTFTLNDTLGSPGQINSATPLFTLQADGALAQYTIKVDDTVLPGVYRNYTSSTVCIKAPMLADGLHTISAVELAPGFGPIDPYTFIVDTAPPAPATITTATFSNGYVRMSGSGIATFHISAREVGAAGTGGAWVGGTGLWSVAYSRPSGSHTLYVVQADKAGNESGPSNTVGVVVP